MSQRLIFLVVYLLVSLNLYAQSPFENALNLIGSYQYFEIPDAFYLNLDKTRDFTLEIQFKANTSDPFNLLNKWKYIRIDTTNYIWYGQGWVYDLYRCSDKTEGKIDLHYLDPLDGFPNPNASRINFGYFQSARYTQITINDWHHVAFVFNKSGNFTIYLDGNVWGDYQYVENISTPGYPLNIGGFPFAIDSTLDTSTYFNGLIDEIRIWNNVRSSGQIRSTMNDTLSPDIYNSIESGLVGYYRFDVLENLGIGNDNLADDVRDLSVSGNHGDIKGDADVVSHDGSTFVQFKENVNSPGFELQQNYPNPFNPFTKIKFNIPKSGYVTVRIYDIRGREVETIAKNYMTEGSHEINWFSKGLPSGVYFCRIETKGYIKTMKMVLEK